MPVRLRAATNRPLRIADSDFSPLLNQLNSVLVGKDVQIRLAVACLIARGHLLIEDVPGVGKTTLAQALAASIGSSWQRVQFTSDLLPADLIGYSTYDNQSGQFEFKPGPVFSEVLLADEINRSPPRAQSALLEAMEERQVSVDGNQYSLPDTFFVIATQNPSDQLGAYPLPESQLDRFLVGLSLGYPDAAAERSLLRDGDRRSQVPQLGALVRPHQLHEWAASASLVSVSDLLLDYIQKLLWRTREDPAIAVGLSPRAGIHLLSVARVWALMDQRDFVVPEDVQAVFSAVAGHRLCGAVVPGADLCDQLLADVALP